MKSAIHLLLATTYVFTLGFLGIYASTLTATSFAQDPGPVELQVEFQWGEGTPTISSISRTEAK